MSSIWFLMIVTVSSAGDVTSDLQFPSAPIENTKELCEYWGTRTAAELTSKLGNDYKVFWRCQSVDINELAKAL